RRAAACCGRSPVAGALRRPIGPGERKDDAIQATSANDRCDDAGIAAGCADLLAEAVEAVDLASADGGNDVAGLEADLFGCAPTPHALDRDHAALDVDLEPDRIPRELVDDIGGQRRDEDVDFVLRATGSDDREPQRFAGRKAAHAKR